MAKKDFEPWFDTRESGTSYIPCSWQGYAVVVGYIVLLALSVFLIGKSWGLFIGAAIVLSVLLFLIVSIKSSIF